MNNHHISKLLKDSEKTNYEGTLDHLHISTNVGCESLPTVGMASDW